MPRLKPQESPDKRPIASWASGKEIAGTDRTHKGFFLDMGLDRRSMWPVVAITLIHSHVSALFWRVLGHVPLRAAVRRPPTCAWSSAGTSSDCSSQR